MQNVRSPGQPYRLGFAVKVLGDGGLATADMRRWQSGPHLLRSVELLRPVFDYLARIDVGMYRLSSQVIPYGTHPDLPGLDYRRQLDEADAALSDLAGEATRLGLRLSTHPGQYTVLNATDATIVDKAIADLEQDAELLDRLGQPVEGAVVVHVGGEYGNRPAALDRWERAWARLSDRARARLALENDERLFGVEDVLELSRRTGVRVVLDVHHHRIHPTSSGISLEDALAAACATWRGARPKVHLSSAKTMLDLAVAAPPRRGTTDSSAAGTGPAPAASARRPSTGTPTFPPLRAHADLVAPWDLEAVVTAAPVAIDVMLEAKAKDLALLHLRRTLAEVRPAVAALEDRPSGRRRAEPSSKRARLSRPTRLPP
ncbi:MAG: damage endonuclease [Chloroflexota bacterium]|nr:damage endonuclease [Chloroflexota bacterium]